MATRAAMPRRCVCATAKAATRSATDPRLRRRTATIAGTSAKRTPPNTTENWNYFRRTEPGRGRASRGRGGAGDSGFRQSAQWKWGGPGDGSRSRDEMRALDALELDSDADFTAVKAAHRRLVKETHPDANPRRRGGRQALQAGAGRLRRSQEGRGPQERQDGLIDASGSLSVRLRSPGTPDRSFRSD